MIEIMVVVIIIGILAALAIPVYNRTVERARIAEAVGLLAVIYQAEIRYTTLYGNYSEDWGKRLDFFWEQQNATKYFQCYDIGSEMGADPYDSTDSELAYCVRKDINAGVYKRSDNGLNNYDILINESGRLWSKTSPEVDNILKGMQMQ